jgi:ABC-type lipoprotein release transport system permease subunit
MSTVAESAKAQRSRGSGRHLFWLLAWRNLWRNGRRSGLTIGGIAFAMLLLVMIPSTQKGVYGAMIENATQQLTGHLQVQHRGYEDDPRVESTVRDYEALRERLSEMPHVVAVSGRAQAFVLASAHDRSVGASVMGISPDLEPKVSNLADYLVEGRYLEGADEAIAGKLLMRNLELAVGDELVLLGNAAGGGVAPLVVRVVGVVETALPEVDRTLVQIDLGAFEEAFAMQDEVHVVVLRLDDLNRSRQVAEAIAPTLADELVALPWNDLMPELEQTISIKRISADFLFAVLLVLVVFSVVNTFMMLVYERTRELGMLLAVGMRRTRIAAMLHAEALLLALVGVALGDGLAACLVGWLANIGITLGDLGEMLRRYHMPDRLRPAFDPIAATLATLVMVVMVQLGAAVATARIRRLTPVDALRRND